MLHEEPQMRDRDLRGFDGGSARTTKGAGGLGGAAALRPPSRAEGVACSWMD